MKNKKYVKLIILIGLIVITAIIFAMCKKGKSVSDKDLSQLVKEMTPSFDQMAGGGSYTFYFDTLKITKRKTVSKQSDTVWATVTYTTEDKLYSIADDETISLSYYTQGGWQIDQIESNGKTILVNKTMSEDQIKSFLGNHVKIKSNELKDTNGSVIDEVLVECSSNTDLHKESGEKLATFYFDSEQGWMLSSIEGKDDYHDNWFPTVKYYTATEDNQVCYLHIDEFNVSLSGNTYSCNLSLQFIEPFDDGSVYRIAFKNITFDRFENGTYYVNGSDDNGNKYSFGISDDKFSLQDWHGGSYEFKACTGEKLKQIQELDNSLNQTVFDFSNSPIYSNGTTDFNFAEIDGKMFVTIGYNGQELLKSCPLQIVEKDRLEYQDNGTGYDLTFTWKDANTIVVLGNDSEGYTPDGDYTKIKE